MKTRQIRGQKNIAYNQYGPKKTPTTIKNSEIAPIELPKTITGHAREYYWIHIERLCKEKVVGENNWHLFLALCEAYGDWQDWRGLVAEQRVASPKMKGFFVVEGVKVKLSVMQSQKQKAEKHFQRMHREFFKSALEFFGNAPEEDDGYGDD